MHKTADSIKYGSKNFIKRLLIKRFQSGIISLINLTQANRILDVGCGEGYLLKFINDRIKNCDLEAFDINKESVNRTKEKVPSVNLSVQDIYKSNYSSESFDLVLCIEVLEHLQYPEKALAEIRHLTKKWAILSVPDDPLFSLSNLVSGKDILRLGVPEGHCNKWSTRSFVDLVNKYFTVSSVLRPFPWTVVLCEKQAKSLK